ncbi:hypothetical protein FYJ24_05250 [Actinomycetaceae bacterium WB03_NA08]|uniref:Uncharacterized protein n=1 Tax=Scrofimicrobium canadense TaxID=2652290 RepID=A0A6N7W6X5_9ACTO|nr:hypothetical protein [Scrofimicrobium canadense]MSS84182.1 hypothetical protein [Scrofimicrobium canadense]
MASRTSAAEIRALLIYLYQDIGVWITRKQVNHLIGGRNRLIDSVREQVIAEYSEPSPQAFFNALAVLHDYPTPSSARDKINTLLRKGNYQRLARNELRAIAAIVSPTKDTQKLTKNELVEILESKRREDFLKSVMLQHPTYSENQEPDAQSLEPGALTYEENDSIIRGYLGMPTKTELYEKIIAHQGRRGSRLEDEELRQLLADAMIHEGKTEVEGELNRKEEQRIASILKKLRDRKKTRNIRGRLLAKKSLRKLLQQEKDFQNKQE